MVGSSSLFRLARRTGKAPSWWLLRFQQLLPRVAAAEVAVVAVERQRLVLVAERQRLQLRAPHLQRRLPAVAVSEERAASSKGQIVQCKKRGRRNLKLESPGISKPKLQEGRLGRAVVPSISGPIWDLVISVLRSPDFPISNFFLRHQTDGLNSSPPGFLLPLFYIERFSSRLTAPAASPQHPAIDRTSLQHSS